ncbi:hypothetical protein LC612_33555, partial [Nostoc sp. CHAB 5834]|nr:hypothetical protein [Nostoc sp. CHAB 5834]
LIICFSKYIRSVVYFLIILIFLLFSLCNLFVLQIEVRNVGSNTVLANSSTKVVLAVDQVEAAKVARRFRFALGLVTNLQPLEALIRMDNDGFHTKIKPYYERV